MSERELGGGDVAVNGSGEVQRLIEVIRALSDNAELRERVAKLEQWKKMADRPRGQITKLDGRVGALEEWKTETKGSTAQKMNWKALAGVAVLGGAVSQVLGWLLTLLP